MSAKKHSWVKSAFGNHLSSSQTITEDRNNVDEANPPKRRSSSFSQAQLSTTKQKLLKKNNTDTNSTSLISTSNWINSFAPQTSEDLAVHAKKVAELQNWLSHCDAVRRKFPAQLCLLTGPPGAGKTASVRVLAEAFHYKIQEWINPVDEFMAVGSQLEEFKRFLLRTSRFKSLLDLSEKRLLLVEDFPNVLLNDAVAFESFLEDFVKRGKSPLIFIVADSRSRSLNISYNLFSDLIRTKFRITHISLNAVAATLMQKAIKRFCTIMRQHHTAMYKVPSQAVVDSIVVSAQGDIRNALINLHFASLKGVPALLTKHIELADRNSASSSQNKKKSSSKSSSTLKSVGCDESITMMHALGRVFNPKFTDARTFLHSPEEIAEAFSTEPKKFIDFVHANYLPHFCDIEHLIAATDGLSYADLILNEYREDALVLAGLMVGVRSVMVANAKPVTGWMPVHGPKRWEVATKERNNAIQVVGLSPAISANLYATDYSTFLQHIIAEKRQQEPSVSANVVDV